jgi:type IV pilus assembly protein PilW
MNLIRNSKNKSFQNGISLIEICIAMVLSALLVSAMFSILADSSQTMQVQKGVNRIIETSRFTQETLAREIRKAGYRENVMLNFRMSYPADAANNFAAGQFLNGTSNLLRLRYLGSGNPADGLIIDCLGNPVSNTEIAVIQLSLNAGNLVCTRLGTGWGTSQVLGSHINSLQFAYGIENNGDGYIDAYANSVMAGDKAISIKNTITVLDKTAVDTAGNPTPNLIEKSFSQTIKTRNIDS